MGHISTTEVYTFDTEDAALSWIEDFKSKHSPCPVEHQIKQKVKKDRKTGEIISETWTATCKVKYTL